MKFKVTWGPETREVDVAHAEAAWPVFCSMVPAALKHPNLYERQVEAVEVVESVAPSVEPVPEVPPAPETVPEPTPEPPAPEPEPEETEPTTLDEPAPDESSQDAST